MRVLIILAATMVWSLSAIAEEWRPAERWRGFNLLGMFMDWGQQPGFDEFDFQVMREWGFNFARLPMDYRFWIKNKNWDEIDEDRIKLIDQAVAWGEKYHIHVQLCFHRAPGYTVAKPPEQKDLFTDSEAQRVCCKHWAFFAKRYRGIPNERMSFNLFNEPAQIKGEVYAAVAKKLIAAIRAEDPNRFIVADGTAWGTQPVTELYGLENIGQATRGYTPMGISHFKANWVTMPEDTKPIWPLPPLAATATRFGPTKAPWNTPLKLLGLPPGKLTLEMGRISGDITLEIKVDGTTRNETVIEMRPDSPYCAEVKHYPEWNVYQGRYTKPIELELSQPSKRVEIDISKGDWAQIIRLAFSGNNGKSVQIPIAQAWGMPEYNEVRFAGWDAPSAFTVTDAKNSIRYPDSGREYLYRNSLSKWDEPLGKQVFCMVGEFGAHNKTPHPLVLAWLEDNLKLWQERRMGWALWNLRGSFGIIDSGRSDVEYEEFRGYKLDRKMLELLRRY